MKILITGCAGFIGSHLAEALIDKGYEIVGIDNFSTGNKENISQFMDCRSFKFVEGDVSDVSLLDELVGSCDAIYHLAASVGVKLLIEEPVDSLVNNVKSVLTILELSNKYKKKLFFASSSEVYGKSDKKSLAEVDSINLGVPSITRWGYGCTKAFAEYLAMSYYKQFGLPVVVGRFFNVCGPRQTGCYGMVIPRFVVSALKEESIKVFGDGTQTRSFVYVTDAVDAMIRLMEIPEAEGGIFNIGNSRFVTIMDLAEMIKKQTGSKVPIVTVSYSDVYGPGFEDMQYRVPDVSRLEEVIGFRPKVNLEKMLEYIVEYWVEELKKPVSNLL